MTVDRGGRTQLLAAATSALERRDTRRAQEQLFDLLVPDWADVAGVACFGPAAGWRARHVRRAAGAEVQITDDWVRAAAETPGGPINRASRRDGTDLIRFERRLPGEAMEPWSTSGLTACICTPLHLPAPARGFLLAGVVQGSGRRLGEEDAHFADALAQRMTLHVIQTGLLDRTGQALDQAQRLTDRTSVALDQARELLQTAPHPVAILIADGADPPRYERLNPLFAALDGRGMSELVGRPAKWFLETMEAFAPREDLLRFRLGELDAMHVLLPDGVLHVTRLQTVNGARRFVAHRLPRRPGEDVIPTCLEPQELLPIGGRHVHPEAAQKGVVRALNAGHELIVAALTLAVGTSSLVDQRSRVARQVRNQLQRADLVTWLPNGALMCVVVDHLLEEAEHRFDRFTADFDVGAIRYADTSETRNASALLRRVRT